MRYLSLLCFLLWPFSVIFGQQSIVIAEGVVSYLSSQHVYVKFESTQSIEIGDTLFIQENDQYKAALEIKHISSISCVGIRLDAQPVHVGDIMIKLGDIEPPPNLTTERSDIPGPEEMPEEQAQESPEISSTEVNPGQEVPTTSLRGRVGASSYYYFSNTSAENSMRMRYNFSLSAQNIAGTNWSTDSYIIFRHRANHWSEVQQNLAGALKVYNFAIKYEPDEHTQISLGRKINHRISNVGAIDGLQVERTFGQFSFGAVGGFRPDPFDYDLNTKLVQFGGFVSHSLQGKHGPAETTFALFEQKNGQLTDRRFGYLQHSSTLLERLYLFASFEVDLYRLTNGNAQGTFSPTSSYISLRYRAGSKISVSASYDARKNVIYYETYKSFVDDLIDRATRQGLRFRITYRPWKYVTTGSSAGYRYQKGTSSSAKNAYFFLTYSRLPWLGVSATASVTWLESSYLSGLIYGARMSKDLFKGKCYIEGNYRRIYYRYGLSESSLRQGIGGGNITWRVSRGLSLSMNYEGTFEKGRTLNRIYTNLIQRF